MSDSIIRYWDADFNELTQLEAEYKMMFDMTSVSITVQEADGG